MPTVSSWQQKLHNGEDCCVFALLECLEFVDIRISYHILLRLRQFFTSLFKFYSTEGSSSRSVQFEEPSKIYRLDVLRKFAKIFDLN